MIRKSNKNAYSRELMKKLSHSTLNLMTTSVDHFLADSRNVPGACPQEGQPENGWSVCRKNCSSDST